MDFEIDDILHQGDNRDTLDCAYRNYLDGKAILIISVGADDSVRYVCTDNLDRQFQYYVLGVVQNAIINGNNEAEDDSE